MTTLNETKIDSDVRHAMQEHLLRYRMTVLAAVQQMPEFKAFGRKRTAAILHQLCRSRDFGHAPLYRNRRYFFLAARGSKTVANQSPSGSPDDQCGPLSELAKIKNYAMLAFCCLGRQPRHRLNRTDFDRCFPDLTRPGLPMNYYVDTSQSQPRLGFLRVDAGGRGRWDRVLAKCRHDVEAHCAQDGFRRFINRNAFEITVITALPQKARRLAESIGTLRDGRVRMIRVSAMPELLNLIAPPAY
jgi:hypothetical protein